jgi:photosystem II stability/assembly factor-like uncharacterized protein
LLAPGGGGVIRSPDGGIGWIDASNGLPSTGVESFTADPTHPGTLDAGTFGEGVFKTTDGGNSWQASGLVGNVRSIAIPPLSSSTVYSVTDTGVHTSNDAGASWAYTNAGLPLILINSIAADMKKAGVLYAGTSGGGIYKTTDRGGTWSQKNFGLPMTSNSLYEDINCMAIAPTDRETLYCGLSGGRGVYKSEDEGATWTAANAGLPTSLFTGIYAVAIDPTSRDTAYAGCYSVYKTTDGGSTWKWSGEGLPDEPVLSIAVDPQDTQVLFAGVMTWDMNDGGVFKSSDGAATWKKVYSACSPTAPGDYEVAIDPFTPTTVYAITDCGFAKTLDGGTTWQQFGLILGQFTLDPSNP